MDTPGGPSQKRIRSQQPDVIVAVGSGESMQEFPCYRVILSFASDYFDSMLSAEMIENKTGRIEFPDKDPQMWTKFYSFIDPDKLRVVETHTKFDVSTAITFVPWFHEFQMTSFLTKCDVVLAERVEEIKADENESLYEYNEFVKNGSLFEVVELLKMSCTYDLDKTKEKTELFICSLLENPQSTSDLFNVERIKTLHKLFSPVKKHQFTVYYEDDQEEEVREMTPSGKCKRIFNTFMNMLVSSDEKLLIFDLVSDLSNETINNAEVFPHLLHSYVQRAVAVATTLNYKQKLADKDKTLGAAKSVINDMLRKIPGTANQYNELFQSIEGQVQTEMSRNWACLYEQGVLSPTRIKQQYRENNIRFSQASSAAELAAATAMSWRSPVLLDQRQQSHGHRRRRSRNRRSG